MRWLSILAGPDLDVLVDWIYWAAPSRCDATVPALALIGGSHVGKGLLADGVARAAGAATATKLGRALGRFNAALADGPILFADEGLPRNDQGQPMTEEFRTLLTATTHKCEQKGIDRSALVHGGVRVVLAANKADRLFSNRGNLGGHDVAGLARRLLVIEVEGERRIEASRAASMGLGSTEGDPARLARVAGHFRWIQAGALGERRAPEPRAGSLIAELRRGGDSGAAALDGLEDLITTGRAFVDAAAGRVWVQPAQWARAAGLTSPHALMRVIDSYVIEKSKARWTHPTTRAKYERPERWAAIDLDRLEADGVQVRPAE